jgi:glycosyltransferase involved in cell wall biosynthesis
MIYSLAGGGAERATVELAAGLSRSFDAVDLVVARAEGPYLEDVPPTVRLVDLGATSWFSWLRRLVAYLRDAQPTRLVGVMDVAAVIALVAVRLARSSPGIIVSVRNTFSVHTAHAARWKERLLLPHVVRRLYPRADAIVAVSEGVADDLARVARIPRSRITVIHEPIVTEELFAAARAPVEHPWFADGEPPVVLAAGRLTAQKDYPTLLRAFRAAREQRALRLVVLGEGEERGRLEALARELRVAPEVDFAGFVANPYAFMARASLFVVSSAWEGLPTVMVEAMACGAPVVSTDCPSGPAEILERGRYGRLVAVGDAAALAGAMLATLDDPPPRELLRRRAGEFGPEQAIERYRAVLEV